MFLLLYSMKLLIMLVFVVVFAVAQENIYAIKGGLLAHSTGPYSSGKESGVDINAEVVFAQKLLKANLAVGMDINTNSDTSFIYSGLSWEGKFCKHLQLGAFFGLALHNGDLDRGRSENRQLGTRILFREALEVGLYINEDISVSFMYDHYSNAGLAGKVNQGNDNLGLRLSYYF